MSDGINFLCSRVCMAVTVMAVLFPVAAFGQAPSSQAPSSRTDAHWRPASTRVFIASLCFYKGDENPSFALDERLDGTMAELFQKHGVPRDHIRVLLDDKATLKNIQKEFVEFVKESKPGEHLIAYLSGDLIEAKWENKWYQAEIVAADANRFKVHYTEDTRTKNDKWLTAEQIRPFRFHRFTAGERVQIRGGNDGKWYPGKVLETWESLCLCSYDGYTPDNNEWFGPDRMRPDRNRKAR